MILTQRERYIAIATGATVALVIVLYSLIHYVQTRREVADQIDAKLKEKQQIIQVFKDQEKYRTEFKQMIADGLKDSPADAKGQIRDALESWTPSSGVNEKALNDDRVVHGADFDEIGFKLVGSGPTQTVARMLNRCETTPLPLKVTKIVINPASEGRDMLNFELTVTTICQVDKATRPRGGV